MIYSEIDLASETTIFSPLSMSNGHTTTNLARRHVEWLRSERVSLLADTDLLKAYKKQIFHIGNNQASSKLILKYFESSEVRQVLILHDLYLLDLLRYIMSTPEYRRRFVKVVGQMKFHAISKILSRDQQETSSSSRSLNALEALTILKRENSHLIYHSPNTQFAGIVDIFKPGLVSRLDLPLGYHYFPETNRLHHTGSKIRVLLCGTDSPTKKTEEIIDALNASASNGEITINVIGGIRHNSAFTKFSKENLNLNTDSDNSAWVKAHTESDVCIRLGVGLNGESSGVIRDALCLGLEVIGDEESQILKSVPSYNYFDAPITAESIHSALLNIREKIMSRIQLSSIHPNSLDSYFSAIMLSAQSIQKAEE